MPHWKIRIRDIWLPGIFGRITLLLMGISLLTLYFYLLGNVQGFTDKTLIILFYFEIRILSLTVATGVLSTIAYVATLPFRSRWQYLPIIFSMLATILSLVLYLGVTLLHAFMDGYTAGDFLNSPG